MCFLCEARVLECPMDLWTQILDPLTIFSFHSVAAQRRSKLSNTASLSLRRPIPNQHEQAAVQTPSSGDRASLARPKKALSNQKHEHASVSQNDARP